MKTKFLRAIAVGTVTAGLTVGAFGGAAAAHPGEDHHPHHHHHCTHRDHHHHCTHWS